MGVDDRRNNARLVESVRFTLGFDGFDVTTDTINISASGLLCEVDSEIPVMSKVEMMLYLPSRLDDGSEVAIKAKGVIVRNEKEGSIYKTAIFFIDIAKAHRKRLEAYVKGRAGNAD